MSVISNKNQSNVLNLDTKSHVPALDGLRGVAVMMVLFWHFIVCAITAPAGTVAGYFQKLFHHAYSGVDLFFVLSGFLITGILLNDVGRPAWMKRFWIRRTFRIIPLYILFLSVVLLLHQMGQGKSGGFFEVPATKWPYFLMLQNFQMAHENSLGPWGITWSLAIEEQFYIVFPLFVWLGTLRRWLPIVCILGIGLSLIFRLNGEYLYSFVLPHYRLDGLAAGAMCAWIVRSPVCGSFFAKPWVLNSLFGIGILLLLLITVRTLERHPIDHTVFAFSYAAILLDVVFRKSGVLSNFLAAEVFVFLGYISYPLYLFHEICFWLTSLFLGEPGDNIGIVVVAVIAAVFSIFVALGLTKLISDPLLLAGRKLASKY